jgi:hypothetical protein
MEWVLLLVLGGGAWAARRRSAGRGERDERARELADVRRLADEDVTAYGEQLRVLDAELAGRSLDERTRDAHLAALEAYDHARGVVRDLAEPGEVSRVVDALAGGRYAVACVRARGRGEPVPEPRVPCFFDPRHGPSVTDVLWTPPGRGTRSVPACAEDAARVGRQEAPELRTVRVGGRQVPYWEVGGAYLPYTRGYVPLGAGGIGTTLGWSSHPAAPGRCGGSGGATAAPGKTVGTDGPGDSREEG